jgi:hypothetical protein
MGGNIITIDYDLLAHIFSLLKPKRRKNKINWWSPPKGWTRTVYIFAWTPWKTRDPETKTTGFYTLKYRVYKDGRWKLVKKLRFARRKIAKKRASQWYDKYYGT